MKRFLLVTAATLGTVAFVMAMTIPAIGQVAADGSGAVADPAPSPLADLVRASGHNVLTVAVGAVVVLALFLQKRLGPRGRGGLIVAAVLLTVIAIGITHLGTQDALEHERELAQLAGQQDTATLEAGHVLELDAQLRRHDQEILRLNNDLERARLNASVAITTNDALDRCLDTLKQLQGMTIAMSVTARVDQPGAERMAFQIGVSLGNIIDQSGCARPELETT